MQSDGMHADTQAINGGHSGTYSYLARSQETGNAVPRSRKLDSSNSITNLSNSTHTSMSTLIPTPATYEYATCIHQSILGSEKTNYTRHCTQGQSPFFLFDKSLNYGTPKASLWGHARNTDCTLQIVLRPYSTLRNLEKVDKLLLQLRFCLKYSRHSYFSSNACLKVWLQHTHLLYSRCREPHKDFLLFPLLCSTVTLLESTRSGDSPG